jgi:hypothetical protein
MSALLWVLLVLVVLGVVAFVAASALGVGVLYIVTALFHVFKPAEPPGRQDAEWDRSQGKEAR